MKTKNILGLGLCLLLTVINLHRAMDNYGIIDTKFNVDVLANESSSSVSSEPVYCLILGSCNYHMEELEPFEQVVLFENLEGIADSDGICEIESNYSHFNCILGGENDCVQEECPYPVNTQDCYSHTKGYIHFWEYNGHIVED